MKAHVYVPAPWDSSLYEICHLATAQSGYKQTCGNPAVGFRASDGVASCVAHADGNFETRWDALRARLAEIDKGGAK